MTYYVSIGNSDRKLTRHEWLSFMGELNRVVTRMDGVQKHGFWHSVPSVNDKYQNACICFDLDDPARVAELKSELRKLATKFRQDSIAWADATTTFLTGARL